MVTSITTPSDISHSLRSEWSTFTTLKFTKRISETKIETMNSSSHHSLNDWKPLKPVRTASLSEDSSMRSFFSNSEAEESSIAMSETKQNIEHGDCDGTLVSEITTPSFWSPGGNSTHSLTLFYGEDAIQYIPADDENDFKQAPLPRPPLHDSFGSSDVPPVPVRRSVSSDGDSAEKFFNGSMSDLSLPPKPPKRQTDDGSSTRLPSTQDAAPDNSSSQTQPRRSSLSSVAGLGNIGGIGHRLFRRRSSLSNTQNKPEQQTVSEMPDKSDKPCTNNTRGTSQPRRKSLSKEPSLGSNGPSKFPRRQSLPSSPNKPEQQTVPEMPNKSDKPSTNNTKGPSQPRRTSLSKEPSLGSNGPSKYPRRQSLPSMDGSFSLDDIMMPKVSSHQEKFLSESLSSIGCNETPQKPRRSSLAPSSTARRATHQVQNTLMKRARKFVSLCSVSTHSYHLKKYTRSFVGSEAVDLMIEHGLAKTREDAVFLGHRFCKEYNLFHHVTFDHTFKDGYFFYRFTGGVKEDLSILPYTSLEELRSLGDKFSESMEVSRHSSLMKTYKNSFLGNRAVDHMLAKGLASTRMHAVFLGQRMMEELNLFQHVSDQHQFKDSPHLYRFVAEKERTSFESSTESLNSVMSTIRKPRLLRRMSTGSDGLSSMRVSLRSDTSVTSKSTGVSTHTPPPPPGAASTNKTPLQVTFGNIQLRYFERCLEYNPSTAKGPSVGLGWGYYDEPPISVEDSYMIERSRYGFRLTSECRKYILMEEWGYSKSEIRKATKKNEKIRKNRKKSYNKVTVVRSLVGFA